MTSFQPPLCMTHLVLKQHLASLVCKASHRNHIWVASLVENLTHPLSNEWSLWCHILPPHAWRWLASFPASSAWAEKKEPTHCLRMLSSPRISGKFGNFRKIRSVTLTSTRYADFSRIKGACHWPRSVWTWRRSDEGTQLCVCRNCPCMSVFQLNTAACDWCNLFLWTSPITSNGVMQTVMIEAILIPHLKCCQMCHMRKTLC